MGYNGSGARYSDLHTFTVEQLKRMRGQGAESHPYPHEWIDVELRVRGVLNWLDDPTRVK